MVAVYEQLNGFWGRWQVVGGFGSRKAFRLLTECLMHRLELTRFDSVTQWLVDIRSLTDSECQCVLQGKSLTVDNTETVASPPKLIGG